MRAQAAAVFHRLERITSAFLVCSFPLGSLGALGCGPVDRCELSRDAVGISRMHESGQSYAELSSAITGTYSHPVQWSASTSDEYDFAFELDHSTIATIAIEHDENPVERERWRAVNAADRDKCPTNLEVLGLDVRVTTEDGALDESFRHDWVVRDTPESFERFSTSFAEPNGTLRVESDSEAQASGAYGIGFEITDGTVTRFGVGYGVSRTFQNGSDSGGAYWFVALTAD